VVRLQSPQTPGANQESQGPENGNLVAPSPRIQRQISTLGVHHRGYLNYLKKKIAFSRRWERYIETLKAQKLTHNSPTYLE